METWLICLIVFLSLAIIALAILLITNMEKIKELIKSCLPCFKDKNLSVEGRLTDEQCDKHMKEQIAMEKEHAQNNREILDRMSANCVRETKLLGNLKEIILNNPEIFNEGNVNGKQ